MSDLIINKDGKQWNIYDYILFLENKNERLHTENEKRKTAIKIFNTHIIAARKATSLGLCKKVLINGLGHARKALEGK